MNLLLISNIDIAEFKALSKAVPEKRINQFIRDAQEHDLCPLLGFTFYNEILNNKADSEFQELINGSTYQVNGKDYNHSGLKAVLTEFSWGRYVYEGTYTDAPFGFVQKRVPESDPVSDAGRRDIWKMSKQKANNYFEGVKHFLNNSKDFPIWGNNNCADNLHSSSTLRVNKIS